MIAFYLDENVEGQIVRGLRARGIDILTAEEDGRAATPDPEVLDRATELGRVAFSRDRDFLREGTRRQREGIPFAGVIYARKAHVSIGRCIDDLELLARAGMPEDFENSVQFLPF
jgi:predicted nuclease of predicted toxin-antitoxin system